MTESPKTPPAVSPTAQKKSTILAALVAFADVVLAVTANQFFGHGAVWVVVVIVAGLVFVLLTVFNVRAENGDRIVRWSRIRAIVTTRIFVALVAAAVAAGLTYAVTARTGAHDEPEDRTPGVVAASSSPAVTPSATCPLKAGPGVVEVTAEASAPDGLTFCPALLNNGAPLTGPFTVTGRILGSPDLYRGLIVVGQADPKTCDVYGNKPAYGYFYTDLTIGADGTWSFEEDLGYDEAVTIGRTFSFIKGSPAAVAAIRNDRRAFADAHGGNDEEYAGMRSLPAAAPIVATLHQAPGRYEGKSSPCKTS